jgi:hypothetical protein
MSFKSLKNDNRKFKILIIGTSGKYLLIADRSWEIFAVIEIHKKHILL